MDGSNNDELGTGAVVLSKRSALGLLALVLLVGILVGRTIATDGGARAAALQTEATPVGTTESETDELNRLRTQVAQTPDCEEPSPTPEPTLTATPTPVPPVAAGTEVQAADNWTVVVTGITPAPPIADTEPTGKFLQVTVTVTNNGSESRTYPFQSWILVDEQGRTFEVAGAATTQVTGTGWYRGIAPSLPKDFAIVFDVAADAGPVFILESRDDPTLRVALQIQLLG
jgi:hypothetical protein